MTHTKATAPALLPPTARAPTLTRQERIGAWAVSALRDLVYDGAVALWSIVAFTILVTGVALTASLIVLIIGVFVWVGFVYVVRTSAWPWWTPSERLSRWPRSGSCSSLWRCCSRAAVRRCMPGSPRMYWEGIDEA
jgi:hypothetical protein